MTETYFTTAAELLTKSGALSIAVLLALFFIVSVKCDTRKGITKNDT